MFHNRKRNNVFLICLGSLKISELSSIQTVFESRWVVCGMFRLKNSTKYARSMARINVRKRISSFFTNEALNCKRQRSVFKEKSNFTLFILLGSVGTTGPRTLFFFFLD